MHKKISNTECRKFDNGAMAVNSLANGQIDAVIIDEIPEKTLLNPKNERIRDF